MYGVRNLLILKQIRSLKHVNYISCHGMVKDLIQHSTHRIYKSSIYHFLKDLAQSLNKLLNIPLILGDSRLRNLILKKK